MPTLGEVIQNTSKSAVELYAHHAGQLDVEPNGYRQFLAAVFAGGHASAPYLQPDAPNTGPHPLSASDLTKGNLSGLPKTQLVFPYAPVRFLDCQQIEEPERGWVDEDGIRQIRNELFGCKRRRDMVGKDIGWSRG